MQSVNFKGLSELVVITVNRNSTPLFYTVLLSENTALILKTVTFTRLGFSAGCFRVHCKKRQQACQRKGKNLGEHVTEETQQI